MNAFRQAACQYPSVSIRMIDNYARIAQRIADRDGPMEMIDFLEKLAKELRDHADSVTSYEEDERAINRAFAEGFPHDRQHEGAP